MHINTRVFGEIEIEDEKIIMFDNGIVGFPEMQRFAIVHDEEKGVNAGIRYLQSLDETEFAMPVMDPLAVMPDYNPEVEDELLKPIGDFNEENLLVLVTVSVPREIKKISVNLQAPIIINAEEKKGVQVILESGDYKVKYPIYDILQGKKEKCGRRRKLIC